LEGDGISNDAAAAKDDADLRFWLDDLVAAIKGCGLPRLQSGRRYHAETRSGRSSSHVLHGRTGLRPAPLRSIQSDYRPAADRLDIDDGHPGTAQPGAIQLLQRSFDQAEHDRLCQRRLEALRT